MKRITFLITLLFALTCQAALNRSCGASFACMELTTTRRRRRLLVDLFVLINNDSEF